jgi:integrase
MLAEHLANQNLDASQPDALVFTSPRGGRLWPSNFHKRDWTPALAVAGLEELTFHSLRHASFALAIEQGAHPRQIQERLGHPTIVTTFDTYGHVLTSSEKTLDRRLERRFAIVTGPANTRPAPRTGVVSSSVQHLSGE